MDSHTELHIETSALLTIDMQCDLLDGAPFCIAGTSAVLEPLTRLATAFRAAARPIVHLVRLYDPSGADIDRCRRAEAATGGGMLRLGSPGCQLAPGLAPADPTLDSTALMAGRFQRLGADEWVAFKPRWGAFYRTTLETHLGALGVDTVVVAGCNYPNCPRTTIYEASERDYRVALVTDAVSGLYPRGETEMAGIGVMLCTADQLTAQLGGLTAG